MEKGPIMRTLEEVGGKFVFDLVEGDSIQLTSGNIVTFISAARVNITFVNKDGDRKYINRRAYVKFLGVDAEYIAKYKKGDDISITKLVRGDVFAYYNGGKLQDSLWVVMDKVGKRIKSKNIANNNQTHFSSNFIVIKKDLLEIIKENNC